MAKRKKGASAAGAAADRQPSRTPEQQQKFEEVISNLLKKDRKGRPYSLQLNYIRGQHAEVMMSSPEQYGRVTVRDIAVALGVETTSVKMACRFAKLVTKEQLEQICALEAPPAWRDMVPWMSMEDSRRSAVLEEIVSGKLSGDELRVAVRAGRPARPAGARRPQKPSGVFKRVDSSASALQKCLEWLDVAVRQVSKMDPDDAKALKGLIKDTATTLGGLVRELPSALKKLAELK